MSLESALIEETNGDPLMLLVVIIVIGLGWIGREAIKAWKWALVQVVDEIKADRADNQAVLKDISATLSANCQICNVTNETCKRIEAKLEKGDGR